MQARKRVHRTTESEESLQEFHGASSIQTLCLHCLTQIREHAQNVMELAAGVACRGPEGVEPRSQTQNCAKSVASETMPQFLGEQ